VPDDLVHVGRQLAGEGAPPIGALRLLARPRELGPERGGVDLSYASFTFDSDTDLLP